MAEGSPFRLAKGVITAREAVAIGAILVGVVGGGGLAWGFLRSDVNALAKRADTIDSAMHDVKIKIDETHDTTLELRANQHETRTQLDRIEYSLTGRPPPAPHPAGGPR